MTTRYWKRAGRARRNESLIQDLRDQLSGTDHVGVSVDDTFLKLMRSVIHHVADEETHLLPVAERLMKDGLGELGMAMTKRRVVLLKPHAGEIAISAARSFPAGAAAGAVINRRCCGDRNDPDVTPQDHRKKGLSAQVSALALEADA